MPFGVRKTPTPIPADGEVYACPLCKFVTTDKNAMINHLVTVHKMKKKDAKALVEST